jgi:hypothetical protein
MTYDDVNRMVEDVASQFTQQTGKDVPGAWVGEIENRIKEHLSELNEDLNSSDTSDFEIRQNLYDQFLDAWDYVDAHPDRAYILLTGGEDAILRSIERNCRFIFWCWGKGKKRSQSQPPPSASL